MKSLLLYLFLGLSLLISPVLRADDDEKPLLNTIQLNLSGEKWVQSSTAKVIVSVDAVLDKAGLEQTHQKLTQKLKQISGAAEWHITLFNRSQDPSGLEKVYVQAEARLPESELSGLREHAEKVSKPGEKFEIQDVFFEPTLDDMERTRESLRADLYAKAKKELERINSIYPDRKYFLHQLMFDGLLTPQPGQPKVFQAQMRSAEIAPAADAGITISNKVQQNASVIFGNKVE